MRIGKSLLVFALIAASFKLFGQGNLSFQCKDFNLSVSQSLQSDAMSEDDPNDLAEAWGYLIAYYPAIANNANHFELRFPTRVGTYHWTQNDAKDKNDSLSAELFYHSTSNSDQDFDAYPMDFTVTITRYDNTKGGIVEGTFNGTMGFYSSDKHTTLSVSVKGSFHTTRTGKGQECRKLRRAERPVFEKALAVSEDVLLEPLKKLGWQITEEQKISASYPVLNHPAPFRPLAFCSAMIRLKLTLDIGSEYGKKLQDSANYYANQSQNTNGDDKALIRAIQNMSRIQKMQNIEVKVSENYPYIKQRNPMNTGGKFTVLRIPNVSYAFQFFDPPSDVMGSPSEGTSLYFGNWAGADMNFEGYVNYPFVHKQQSPFIENMVISIDAPASVANSIIKSIDWSKMNEALTR